MAHKDLQRIDEALATALTMSDGDCSVRAPGEQSKPSLSRSQWVGSLGPHERLLVTLGAIAPLTAEAQAEIAKLPMRVEDIAAGCSLLPADQCLLALRGCFARQVILADGQRQILSFHLPGDILNLQSLHLHEVPSFEALSAGGIASVPCEALRAAFVRAPDLSVALWRASLAEQARLSAWLTAMGRRSAKQRMAHLFCEVFVRLRTRGLADELTFVLPVTQYDLADALGLSPVHVNRTLKQLRAEGALVPRGRHLGIADWGRLQAAGDFDDAYLREAAKKNQAPVGGATVPG